MMGRKYSQNGRRYKQMHHYRYVLPVEEGSSQHKATDSPESIYTNFSHQARITCKEIKSHKHIYCSRSVCAWSLFYSNSIVLVKTACIPRELLGFQPNIH